MCKGLKQCFNRTLNGIEMLMLHCIQIVRSSFNRTLNGIEIGKHFLLFRFHRVLIVP